MSNLTFILISLIFPVFSSTRSLFYLGCYSKDPRVSDLSNQGQYPDLWYHPTAEALEHDIQPYSCVAACTDQSFRFAGLSSGIDRCQCGSSYGSTGPGQCHPCRLDQPFTQEHCGAENSWSIYDTGFKVPSPPQKMHLVDRSETTLVIGWTRPVAPNGPLTAYQISTQGLFTYSRDATAITHLKTWQVSDQEEQLLLAGLAPATKYNVSIVAINSEGQSTPASVTAWSKIGFPDTPPPPTILKSSPRRMTIQLSQFQNTKGPLTKYRIVMVDESRLFQTRIFTMDRVVTWNDTVASGYPKYVTAQFSPANFPTNGEFVIGDGLFYDGFFNGEIPEEHWHPVLGIVSTLNNLTEISYSTTIRNQQANGDDTLAIKIKEDPPLTAHAKANKHSTLDLSESTRRTKEMSPTVVALWVAIGVTAAILLLCVGVYSILTMDLGSERRRPALPAPFSPPFAERPTELVTCAANPSYIFPDDFNEVYKHLGFVQDKDMRSRVLERLKHVWNIPRSLIPTPSDENDEVKLLGQGRYGPVHLSRLQADDTQKPVALYDVQGIFRKSQGDEEESKKFMENVEELVRIDPHVNVAKLMGFVDDSSSLLFVMEFGAISLKEWLLDFRKSDTSEQMSRVVPYNLILCAMNIAEAMFHLSSFRVTHGELAASNVLVTSLQCPKVSGFGLLKCDPPLERIRRDFRRWFAVEQFQNRCIKSCDIWSFGVVLWEISSLGATPYHDVRNEDLSKRLGRGLRLDQLEVIGDPLYQLMLHCWQLDREERPDFATLSCSLHQLLPNAVESLVISPSFNYPPYMESFEQTT